MYDFSVVIPAYENEDALKRALNSISDQKHQNIEIIVSDDCSKKANLKKVCDEFSKQNSKLTVRYFYQEKNLSPTLNTKFIFEKAKGKFILSLPHDDYLIDKSFFSECNSLINQNKNLTCLIANSYSELSKKKMFEDRNEAWQKVEDIEKFLTHYLQKPPAYSAILVKRETLIQNEYFKFYFNQQDYKKFKYEPDEIMTASILCIFHGETIISGKVVSVRGTYNDNYSASDFWRKTYRISVAMPLLKLFYYFKDKNQILSKHYLKLAVFRYCFVPLNVQSLFYFKRFDAFFIMIFSRVFYKIRFYRGVIFLTKKLFDLNGILKR